MASQRSSRPSRHPGADRSQQRWSGRYIESWDEWCGRQLSSLWEAFTGLDHVMLFALLLLAFCSAFNLVEIGDSSGAVHQLEAVGLGVGLMVVLQRARMSSLRIISWLSYLLALVMLVAVTVHGQEVNGARRWLLVGGQLIQPSEFAKLGLLLVLADVLGNQQMAAWQRLGWAVALTAIPVGLTLHQPDLSTSALLVLVLLASLLLARLKPLLIIGIMLAAVGSVAGAWPLLPRLLRPYQMQRLQQFIGHNKAADPQGAGWQSMQAKVAVGAGGVFGIWRTPYHQLWAQYLPARQTDLAYASLVEQGGFLMGALALCAVLLVVWRLVVAAREARIQSASLMAGTFAVLYGLEVAVNVASNLNALPLAGVPFPLLSYGGTAAAAHLAALGLVLAARQDAESHRLWMAPSRFRSRPRLIRLAALGLTGAQLSLAGLAWQVQVNEGDSLSVYGLGEMTRCFTLPAPRGIIADRHGAPLAINYDSYRLFVIPGLLLQNQDSERSLAKLAGMPEPDLHNQLVKHTNSIAWEVQELPNGVGKKVQAAHIKGVVTLPSDRRNYPYGAVLGPTLGYTTIADPQDMKANPQLSMGSRVGKAGVEAEYDRLLRGKDGQYCVLVTPSNQVVDLLYGQEAVQGGELRLTIDLQMQLMADARAQKALQNSTSDQVGAVIMDPRSGAILALASRPAYDDNLFSDPHLTGQQIQAAQSAPGHPFLSHTFQTSSPPGSNFKLVMAAADCIYGAIPPTQVIPTGYSYRYGNAVFTNWRDLPPQNLMQAIAWSNDVYFYQLGRALGSHNQVATARALGVGQPTGIDLPGEDPGFLGDPDHLAEQVGYPWDEVSTIIFSIGQGPIMATPLQDARWTAAVASGQLVTPYIGAAYFDAETGALVAIPHPAPQPLPFAGKLQPVRDGMRLGVTGGTSNLLQRIPIEAGGKTGTAEDPSTVSGREDGWYTTDAPVNSPRVTMTMEARGSGEGYYVAEPAIADMLSYYVSNEAQVTAAIPTQPKFVQITHRNVN